MRVPDVEGTRALRALAYILVAQSMAWAKAQWLTSTAGAGLAAIVTVLFRAAGDGEDGRG